MQDSEKTKRFARKLLELSMEGDCVSAERVDAVLESLRTRNPRHTKPVLKKYLFYITREINRSVAKIELAGEPTPESLKAVTDLLGRQYDRKIEIICEENLDLIAGMKIRIADDVWDEDIATHLENLKYN